MPEDDLVGSSTRRSMLLTTSSLLIGAKRLRATATEDHPMKQHERRVEKSNRNPQLACIFTPSLLPIIYRVDNALNLFYITEEMKRGELLGSLEHIILLALVRLEGSAHGMIVRREIEERTGRNISIGAVYATLERLEAKGYVSVHPPATRRPSAGAGPSGCFVWRPRAIVRYGYPNKPCKA
jgi:hypothetical protein